MANAKQAFKFAFSIARKHSSGLMADSTDSNTGGVDEEALKIRTVNLVARKMGTPKFTQMPATEYFGAIASAKILMDRVYRHERSLAERLEVSRPGYFMEDDGYIDD